MISEIGQTLLEENRDSLNERFRKSRAQGSKLDSAEWLDHVRRRILPIVDRVHVQLPERANRVLNELYDVSLELFSAGCFAETSGQVSVSLGQLWESSIPALAGIVARDPRRVAGSLSNAVVTLALAPSSVLPRWLQLITAAGPQCESVEQLLRVGSVAAWLAGLPEYRAAALRHGRLLPARLVRELLRLRAGTVDREVSAVLDAFEQDPWGNLSLSTSGNSTIRLVATCGAFRGFSGLFLYPPRVSCENQSLFVGDSINRWQISADAFGQSFHRADGSQAVSPAAKVSNVVKIDAKGLVTWGHQQQSFPELADCSSQAFDGRTLAVTLPNSFHVYLLAQASAG
ncbi:MAG: hypothetical protein JNK57_05840 [Planctomycetaceae bacterium]|nr:hypothetical protein [Planctomycetaceae bacterium]